jgi:hypothetical protein
MAQMDSGIGGLPAGAIDNEGAFAGGGIVAFAAGDPVESKPPTYNLTDDQKAYLAETDKIVGLPPGTSYRQIEVESAFNPRAVSPAKAMGLAQIIPDTLPGASRLVGRKIDPFNPTDALEAHRALMKENMGRFKDPVKALRAYNGGWTESTWNDTEENRKYAPKILGFLTGSGNANAAPDTDRQTNPYAVGAGAMAAAGAAALPPVKTGIASGPVVYRIDNDPTVFRSNRVPPASVPPAGPPAGSASGISAAPANTAVPAGPVKGRSPYVEGTPQERAARFRAAESARAASAGAPPAGAPPAGVPPLLVFPLLASRLCFHEGWGRLEDS